MKAFLDALKKFDHPLWATNDILLPSDFVITDFSLARSSCSVKEGSYGVVALAELLNSPQRGSIDPFDLSDPDKLLKPVTSSRPVWKVLQDGKAHKNVQAVLSRRSFERGLQEWFGEVEKARALLQTSPRAQSMTLEGLRDKMQRRNLVSVKVGATCVALKSLHVEDEKAVLDEAALQFLAHFSLPQFTADVIGFVRQEGKLTLVMEHVNGVCLNAAPKVLLEPAFYQLVLYCWAKQFIRLQHFDLHEENVLID